MYFDPGIEDQLIRAILALNQGFTVPTSYFQPGWQAGQLNVGGRPNPVAAAQQEAQRPSILEQLQRALMGGLNPAAAGNMNPYAAQQYPTPPAQPTPGVNPWEAFAPSRGMDYSPVPGSPEWIAQILTGQPVQETLSYDPFNDIYNNLGAGGSVNYGTWTF